MEYRFFAAHRGKRMRTSLRFFRIIILACLLVTFFCSAFSKDKSKPAPAAIPVTVDTAIQKTVPVQLRAIGNVQTYSTVTVKSKVGMNVRCHLLACSTVDDKSLTTRKT